MSAAGNEGGSGFGTEVQFPARLSNCSATVPCPEGFHGAVGLGNFDALGRMIAVGAVDANNAISSFSNRAGDTATATLVAPGENIVTTAVGGGTVTASGTSFSAPQVSGGVALMLERFPGLTPEQAVQILLTTATDLGLAGVGQGLLNLSAALAPLGTLSVAAGKGSGADLDATTLTLGAAFGDALVGAPALTNAIVLDSFGRAYLADLSALALAADEGLDLENLLAHNQERRADTLDVGADARLSFAFTLTQGQLPGAPVGWRETDNANPAIENPELAFSAPLSGNARMALGFGAALMDLLGAAALAGAPADLFLAKAPLASPYLAMVGQGEHLAVELAAGARTRLALAVASGERDFGELHGSRARHAAFIELARGRAPELRWSARFGTLTEDGSVLDSVASGAYDSFSGARTMFAGLSGVLPVSDKWTLAAYTAQGVTRVDDTGVGLLQDFTEIATSSYGVSLLAAGVVAGGDRLGLSISQPLRAWRAGARAVVPTGIDYASGAVTHSREGVELVAGGREIDLEVSYAFTPFRGVDLGANLLYQHEPGHMREAAGAATLVIRLNRRF